MEDKLNKSDDVVIEKDDSAVKKGDEKANAIKKLVPLIKELIGDRSVRQTSVDSGVTAAYIYGIARGRYLPSPDILKKLTAPGANPKNGITLEDLMVAAGYQEDYVDIGRSFIEDLSEDTDYKYDNQTVIEKEIILNEKISNCTDEDEKAKLRRELSYTHAKCQRMHEMNFESMGTGIIFKTLVNNGIKFSSNNNSVGIGVCRSLRPDMSISMDDYPVHEWWFEFKLIRKNMRHQMGERLIESFLSVFMMIEPKEDRKVSIVINDEEAYESTLKYKDKLSYRGDLSIILIDEKTYSVVKEEYLSHFNLYSNASEFYII